MPFRATVNCLSGTSWRTKQDWSISSKASEKPKFAHHPMTYDFYLPISAKMVRQVNTESLTKHKQTRGIWLLEVVMRLCALVVICCLAIVLGQPWPALTPAQQLAGSVADGLVGTWRLVGVETKRPNGEVIYPFYGKHPEGLLIYDRSGCMSVQIVSDPKPTVPRTSSREGFLAAPPAEKLTAVDGYYAYFGTWTVDSSGSTVTHHIQQSLYPGERDQDGIRRLVLEGNRLTLVAKAHEMGEDHERRLVWERIPPVSH